MKLKIAMILFILSGILSSCVLNESVEVDSSNLPSITGLKSESVTSVEESGITEEFSNVDTEKEENVAIKENTTVWDNCPITITGGISGSSHSEIIKINVTNTTSNDIDSVKLMIVFDQTNYDYSTTTISGFYTIDTIWANETSKHSISGGNYNFLRAQIYPVCIYYKNGAVWGNSNANFEEIRNNSQVFEIEHFALNEVVVYENDIAS